MKPLNVGIIGFGFIGKVHAYGYLNLPLFYEALPVPVRLHSVCTSRQETAERARKLLNCEHACTDFREITESPDMDIVHICTPNVFHKDALLSAIAYGKHIYCEKPLVADIAEAKEVEAALSSYHGTAQMVFHNRFWPATLRAKQLIEEGFVGRVLTFRAGYLHSGSADPQAPLKWKLSRDMGGGVIGDLGSHIFDLMHHLGGDFEAINCTTQIAFAERPAGDGSGRRIPVEAEDAMYAVVRLPDGGVGTIEATKIATGMQDELRFEIHGETGALRFNTMQPNWLEAYDLTAAASPTGGKQGWLAIDTAQRYPEPAVAFPGPKFTIGWLRAHVACLHNFLDAVGCGVPCEPGLEQGVYIERVMDAAKRSDRQDCWMAL